MEKSGKFSGTFRIGKPWKDGESSDFHMKSGFSVEKLTKNGVTSTQEPGFHRGKTWDSNWAKT